MTSILMQTWSTQMSEHAHVDGVYPFPAVMQTRTIETNGTSIHVRVGGRSEAPALRGALCATRRNASGLCPVPGVQPGCNRQQDVPCAGQASDAGLGLGWRSYVRPYDRRGDAVCRR